LKGEPTGGEKETPSEEGRGAYNDSRSAYNGGLANAEESKRRGGRDPGGPLKTSEKMGVESQGRGNFRLDSRITWGVPPFQPRKARKTAQTNGQTKTNIQRKADEGTPSCTSPKKGLQKGSLVRTKRPQQVPGQEMKMASPPWIGGVNEKKKNTANEEKGSESSESDGWEVLGQELT